MDKVIRPSRAFCLKGEVAVVSGAGSRMRGIIDCFRTETASWLIDRCMRDWKWPSNSNTVSAAIAQVVLVDFNEQWASDTKEMIDAEGGESVVVQADVTDESSVQIAVAKAVKTYGKIDILVNIVGVGGAMGDATKLDIAEWNRDMAINVTSMMLMSRHIIPEMRKQGRGSIVNMSSVAGLLGGNPSLLYPTSKGAIIQMTRAMAAQHGPENIRVNCVCPGMVFTPMVRSRGMTDEMRQARINQNLLKREGDAWDVAFAILFLCSKESK